MSHNVLSTQILNLFIFWWVLHDIYQLWNLETNIYMQINILATMCASPTCNERRWKEIDIDYIVFAFYHWIKLTITSVLLYGYSGKLTQKYILQTSHTVISRGSTLLDCVTFVHQSDIQWDYYFLFMHTLIVLYYSKGIVK